MVALTEWESHTQAEQVVEFLCCIPLAAVGDVLAWLKPHLPPPQHAALLHQVRKYPF